SGPFTEEGRARSVEGDGGGDEGAALVGADARHDGGVVASEELCDLGVAVLAVGVVAETPPDLVPGAGDGLRACPPADRVERHGPALADLVDEGKQVTGAEFVGDVGGVHRALGGRARAATACAWCCGPSPWRRRARWLP